MAGNIIPAIATTNAIISGLIVLQALHVLRANPPPASSSETATSSTLPVTPPATDSKSLPFRNVYIQQGRPAVPLGALTIVPPNPFCSVCRDTYINIQCDPARVTLGVLVDAVLTAEGGIATEKREVSVYEGGRVLSDPDFEDNLGKTLNELSCGRGKFVMLVDEDEVVRDVALAVSLLPATHPVDAPPYILPHHIHTPPIRPTPPVPSPPSPPSSPIKQILPGTSNTSKKRSAPVDDDEEIQISDTPFAAPDFGPVSKRAKTTHVEHGDGGVMIIESLGAGKGMSKEEKALEDEGFVILD